MPNLTGRPALPFALNDSAGRLHRLEDYQGHWLLLVFHRHLGWLPCRGHLAQLREQDDEFRRRDVRIAVVTFENDFFARQYLAETGLSWPLLIDASRELYRGYGMLTASFWDIWGPATWRAYLLALLHGQTLKKSSGDIFQRGGDVLIDTAGIVRLHHVGRGPADRPAVETLLRMIGPA